MIRVSLAIFCDANEKHIRNPDHVIGILSAVTITALSLQL